MIRDLGAPGDLGWVVMAHGEQYAAEFGWDASFEALVARIVADYAADHDPAREGAWIAERAGRRVGCVFCVRSREATDDETAQLRILLVTPEGRGLGLGGSWSTARSRSPARRATAGWCCGPTTRSPPRGGSTWSGVSDWSTKNATAVSAPNSSGRTTCSRSDGRIPRRSRRGGKRPTRRR